MSKPIHFEHDILYGATSGTACDTRAKIDDSNLTRDEAEVTCTKCLKALGFEPA
jgi:hypothetical protein